MKFLDVLFCDDIRHELNQKISLMGIYNARITLPVAKFAEVKSPIPVNLAVFLRFERESTEKTPDQFEFEYFLNSKSIIKVKDQFNIPNIEKFNIAIKGLGVPLEPGQLGFTVTLYNQGVALLTETQHNAIKVG